MGSAEAAAVEAHENAVTWAKLNGYDYREARAALEAEEEAEEEARAQERRDEEEAAKQKRKRAKERAARKSAKLAAESKHAQEEMRDHSSTESGSSESTSSDGDGEGLEDERAGKVVEFGHDNPLWRGEADGESDAESKEVGDGDGDGDGEQAKEDDGGAEVATLEAFVIMALDERSEIVAARLHERWRAGRKQRNGAYTPHKKIYGRTVCDTAALMYAELPEIAQGVLRASARCVCIAIEEALREPLSVGTSRSSAVAALVGDGDFVEHVAGLHHGHWKKHADRGADPAMLVPYAKLSESQKEASRIIVATTLEQYFDECLEAEAATHDLEEAAAALAAEKDNAPEFGALTLETELLSMNCIQVRARSYT